MCQVFRDLIDIMDAIGWMIFSMVLEMFLQIDWVQADSRTNIPRSTTSKKSPNSMEKCIQNYDFSVYYWNINEI